MSLRGELASKNEQLLVLRKHARRSLHNPRMPFECVENTSTSIPIDNVLKIPYQLTPTEENCEMTIVARKYVSGTHNGI